MERNLDSMPDLQEYNNHVSSLSPYKEAHQHSSMYNISSNTPCTLEVDKFQKDIEKYNALPALTRGLKMGHEVAQKH